MSTLWLFNNQRGQRRDNSVLLELLKPTHFLFHYIHFVLKSRFTWSAKWLVNFSCQMEREPDAPGGLVMNLWFAHQDNFKKWIIDSLTLTQCLTTRLLVIWVFTSLGDISRGSFLSSCLKFLNISSSTAAGVGADLKAAEWEVSLLVCMLKPLAAKSISVFANEATATNRSPNEKVLNSSAACWHLNSNCRRGLILGVLLSMSWKKKWFLL